MVGHSEGGYWAHEAHQRKDEHKLQAVTREKGDQLAPCR